MIHSKGKLTWNLHAACRGIVGTVLIKTFLWQDRNISLHQRLERELLLPWDLYGTIEIQSPPIFSHSNSTDGLATKSGSRSNTHMSSGSAEHMWEILQAGHCSRKRQKNGGWKKCHNIWAEQNSNKKNLGERGFFFGVYGIASPIHNNGSSLNTRYSIKPERVDCYPRFKKLQMTWFYGKKGVE